MEDTASDRYTKLQESKDGPQEGFGGKAIDFFGGFSLIFNNITGPGMVLLPVLFQYSGWLVPFIGLILFMIVSSLAATMLCKAMARVEGNSNYEERVELCTVAQHFFPKWAYWITFALFVISLQANNISSIIVSAQTMDYAFLTLFKYTCGLEFYPHPGLAAITMPIGGDSPFATGTYLVSLGFVVILVITIPMGYFNLDDNIIVQKGAFLILCLILVEWVVVFFVKGLTHTLPLATVDQAAVVGTVMFNYAFVVSIPSWVNEKKPGVGINSSIWLSNILATISFLALGFLGGMAFKYRPSDDVVNVIDESFPRGVWHILAKLSVYIYPLVSLVSSIPVFSIIVRYNLLENKICKKTMANFWGVIFPWIVAVPLCTGQGLALVQNWVGIIANGLVNFIIPFLLYYISMRREYSYVPYEPYSPNIQETEEPLIKKIPNEDDEGNFLVLPAFIPPLPISLILAALVSVLNILALGIAIAALFVPSLNKSVVVENQI